MPKVAFIFSQFPAYDETFILREMNELRKAGLPFEIYSLKIPKDKIMHEEAKDLAKTTSYLPFFSLKLLSCDLFYLFRYPLRYFVAFFGVLFHNLRSANFFFKTCAIWYEAVGFAFKARKDGITHVHGQWATFPATAAFIISKLNNIPFSFTGHAHDIYLDTTGLAFKMRRAKFITTCTGDNKRYLLNLATGYRLQAAGCKLQATSCKLQAAGHKLKDRDKRSQEHDVISEVLEQKIIINYHGVDLRRFARTEDGRRKSEVGKDEIGLRPSSLPCRQAGIDHRLLILSVGSLLECKGFEYLIEACGMLRDRGVEFECIIAGGGPLESRLRSMVHGRQLEEKITFTGYITQDKLIPIYKEADVFVLAMVPEIHWGIPNVLLEAGAAGVPIVCTMLPSIPELVEDGKTGFIIPAKDPSAIAVIIEKLYRDSELRARIGEAGRKVVEEKFDVVANALRLRDLFNNS